MSIVGRRHFLRLAGGCGALAAVGFGAVKASLSTAVAATSGQLGTAPDFEITLKARQTRAAILPGQQSQVWSHAGELI